VSGQLARLLTLIDDANQADPNRTHAGQPLAWAQGVDATAWLEKLAPDAADEMVIAARAHHLRRWEVPRESYPQGRAGYLRWRRDQKQRHAREIALLMEHAGYEAVAVERVQRLIRRDNLASDPDAQLIEDVACLVFLHLQASDVVPRLGERAEGVLSKTIAKMSPAARRLATERGLLP